MTLVDKPDELSKRICGHGGAGPIGRPRFVSVFLLFWIAPENPIDAEPLLGKNVAKNNFVLNKLRF